MVLSVSLASIRPVLAQQATTAKAPTAPRIEMAVLLDTSNSMDGLIAQAKSQLWKIVNEFATTSRDGRRPELHVALFEYGNDSLPAQEGHIRLVLPLTDNLDRVSEELFKLTTNGGSEYCGQVIDVAVQRLDWSKSNRELKCIFIAGNEPFTLGSVDFRDACQAAATNGITVSTIFCGAHEEGISTMWAEGAKLADGSYMSINQNEVTPAIASPQDQELTRLSAELNKTYLAYGDAKMQKEALDRQVAQDSNAAQAGAGVAATRAQSKASALYNNATWDLCDACRLGKIKLEDLKEEQLPEFLRKMSVAERKTYVDKMTKQRAQVQEQIKQLSGERDKYVAEQLKLVEKTDSTLDVAIIEAVRKQAEQKQFQFEK
jgi:hypothetical protein